MNHRDRILAALDRASDIAGFDAGNLRAPEMQTTYYLQMAQIYATMELTDILESSSDAAMIEQNIEALQELRRIENLTSEQSEELERLRQSVGQSLSEESRDSAEHLATLMEQAKAENDTTVDVIDDAVGLDAIDDAQGPVEADEPKTTTYTSKKAKN